MRTNYELRLRIPLVISDVEPGLKPYPLLAFCKKPVVARSSLAFLHERLVTAYNFAQIVHVVVIVSGSAKQFKGKITYDRRRSVVEEQKLPLQAMPRSELALDGVDQGHFFDELRGYNLPSAHENQPVSSCVNEHFLFWKILCITTHECTVNKFIILLQFLTLCPLLQNNHYTYYHPEPYLHRFLK